MRTVWLKLGVTVLAIIMVEFVILAIFGFSGHWSRLLVYMAYILVLPAVVGMSAVKQKSETYRLTFHEDVARSRRRGNLITTNGIVLKEKDRADMRNYRDSSLLKATVLQRAVGVASISLTFEHEEDNTVILRDIEECDRAWDKVASVGEECRTDIVDGGKPVPDSDR